MTPANLAADPTWGQLALLALLWSLWGALHSLLLWDPLRSRLQQTLRIRGGRYRLYYSLLALATLPVPLWYGHGLGAPWMTFWPWPWLVAQVLLWVLGLGLMAWGFQSFRAGGIDLIGWEQAHHHHHEPPRVITNGAYAWSRHPMYLGGLLLIWARGLGPVELTVNAVLTVYVILGGLHEEARLRRAFGQEYDDYARRVPFVPGLF